MASIRSQKLFDRLSTAVGVSDAGRAWLTAAIDPFHDEPIHGLVGMPDGQNSSSVLQVVRRSITIVAPDTTNKWDCHIQSLPFDTNTHLSGAFGYTNANGDAQVLGQKVPLMVQAAMAPLNCNPITICRGVAGTEVNAFTGSVANTNRFGLAPGNTYVQGLYRVVSKGYEVMSTGPEISSSGSCFVYSSPAPTAGDSESCLFVTHASDNSWQSGYLASAEFPCMPRNTTEIDLLPGTLSWKAKEGCYVVDRMFDCSQQATSGNYTVARYVDWSKRIVAGDSDGGTLWAYDADIIPAIDYEPLKFSGLTPPISVAVSAPVLPAINLTAYHHSGAYFSGLSPTDVLQVNAIWYIERLPSALDLNLVVLAKPTPPRDEQALEIYNIVMSEMPVGMKFDANAFGDWFRDAVSLVTDNVAPALSALPGPLGLLGKAVTVGGGLVKSILPKGEVRPEVPPSNTVLPSKSVRDVVIEEPTVVSTGPSPLNHPRKRLGRPRRSNSARPSNLSNRVSAEVSKKTNKDVKRALPRALQKLSI